jgi:hypothetical protein
LVLEKKVIKGKAFLAHFETLYAFDEAVVKINFRL